MAEWELYPNAPTEAEAALAPQAPGEWQLYKDALPPQAGIPSSSPTQKEAPSFIGGMTSAARGMVNSLLGPYQRTTPVINPFGGGSNYQQLGPIVQSDSGYDILNPDNTSVPFDSTKHVTFLDPDTGKPMAYARNEQTNTSLPTALGQVASFGAMANSPVSMPSLGMGKAASIAAKPVTSFVTPFLKSKQEAIVGHVLNEAAEGAPVAFQSAPLPGMTPTTGQATGNPGLLWLERSIEQRSPAGASGSANARAGSNKAILDAVDSLSGTTPIEQSGEAMRAQLIAAQRAGRLGESQYWEAIPDSMPISGNGLVGKVEDYVSGLTRAARRLIPDGVMTDIKSLTASEPFAEFKDIRSNIATEARAAKAAGDANKARVLNGLDAVVLDHITSASPELKQAYEAAREASTAYHGIFDQPDVAKALAVNKSGFPRIGDASVPGQFMRPGIQGADAWNGFMKTAGDNPDALDAARTAFSQKFLDATTSVAKDSFGNPTVVAGRANKFIKDYSHVINSDLFTDAQRTLINKIGDAADMSARTARAGAPGGSDTFAKLSGNDFLSALVGKWQSQALSTAAGAGAGAHLLGGPFGAIVGATAGRGMGGKFVETIYGAPRTKVMELLGDAMKDPELAQALMMKASPGNMQFLPPRVQNYFYSALSPVIAPQLGEVGDHSRSRAYGGAR